jgi:predicted CXXCH cytochrome family protein
MARIHLVLGLLVLIVGIISAGAVRAEQADCLMCHKQLSEGKVVHAAVMMGCPTCHAGVDASQMPHKFTGTKGLSAEPPDLCYQCHDKSKFAGSTVHAPLSLGMCTSCHNPHTSEHPKLLTAVAPDLCFNCHDKKEFSRKQAHAPVAAGMCTSCHSPHANNNDNLLVQKGVLLCRQCHANVEKEPHVVAGFSTKGHPLRGKKDPKRTGKPFDCLSCHLPHSSDWVRLFRYEAGSAFGLCTHCHTI